MPRISEINEADGEPILEEAFEQERQMFGEVLNPTRVLAHCPTILKCAKNLYASFEESGLVPSTLLALVYARVASLNGLILDSLLLLDDSLDLLDDLLDLLDDLLDLWGDSLGDLLDLLDLL